MWGDDLTEKRGLFQKIFGKEPTQPKTVSSFQLLDGWTTAFTPFSGKAYDVSDVRAAVDAFARRAAKVRPRHIVRGEGKLIDAQKSRYNRLLQFRPNPYSTAYKFYYRMATHYKVYNNAFVYKMYNLETGKLEALYNVNPQCVELVEVAGELYCRMTFSSGNRYTCPYEDMIHIGRHFNTNDLFGENNRPINPILTTAHTFNQSMGKSAELVGAVRGVLEVSGTIKDEDLNKRREAFVRDNLTQENNGSGVVITDNKAKYTPYSDKQTPIPSGQLAYVKDAMQDYFGVNDAIVQNKATPEQESDFYAGEIEPFYEQCTQAFTNGLFTDREAAIGNEIVFEGNSLQNEKLSDKTTTLKFLADIGAVTLDEVLLAYNLPPLGGEEGARRVQTLNMVNAIKADEYQLGTPPPEPNPTPKTIEGDEE